MGKTRSMNMLVLSLFVLFSIFYFSDAYAAGEFSEACVGCSMEEARAYEISLKEPKLIKTADNDLTAPGCLETEIGCYTPNTALVKVGGVVVMKNTDEAGIHAYTSGTVDGFSATADGIFNSGILQHGDSFEWRPDTPGEFPYYCMLHVWMQGTIIVSEGTVPDRKFITVHTDKPSYSNGEMILITGKVSEIIKGNAFYLQVISPNGNLVLIKQLIGNEDKKFSTSVYAGGALMKVEGTYTVRAQYGDNHLATTTFGFSGSTATPTTEANSKCGPGTVFDTDANSCVLNSPLPVTNEENTQLKLENKQLKNKINELQLKIDNLQNIINNQIKIIMDILADLR